MNYVQNVPSSLMYSFTSGFPCQSNLWMYVLISQYLTLLQCSGSSNPTHQLTHFFTEPSIQIRLFQTNMFKGNRSWRIGTTILTTKGRRYPFPRKCSLKVEDEHSLSFSLTGRVWTTKSPRDLSFISYTVSPDKTPPHIGDFCISTGELPYNSVVNFQ